MSHRNTNKTENKLVGGKSDSLSLQDIAKKHGVSMELIKKQLAKGMAVEMEHTNDRDKAKEITMDHLSEMGDYYDRLEKMEKPTVNETKNLIKRLIRERL